MGAIGLNPIRFDRIGLDPIRINAIKLGVPGASSGSDRPYIDPEVLASLKAVCICYGKSNDDPDRAVVKNLVDPDNPFVISNAAFKLNSGFGKYEISLTDSITPTRGAKVTDNSILVVDDTFIPSWIYYSRIEGAIINSYSIKISGMPENKLIQYWYNNEEGIASRFDIRTDGIYTLPQSYAPADTGSNKTIGLRIFGDLSQKFVGLKVEIIPSFEGAFVTDGIDDLITSTKTVQEMDITDEVTVVSMIHQIALNPTYNVGTTNYLENLDNGKHIRSDVYYAGKTGIYGYTASLINNTASDIKNILGDKADYSTQKNEPSQTLHNSKFSVVGRARNLTEPSSVAWYWTVIANKVLTTDQINQVIAYFNLDRTLNPDILCNTIKQGITNENHAEFGDKLIDFSGNGRDIQLNNIAWKGGSGIAAKPFETIKDYTQYQDDQYQEVIIHNEFSYTTKSKLANRYWSIQSNRRDNESLVVTIITDKDCEWASSAPLFNSEGVQEGSLRKAQSVLANTPTEVTIAGMGYFEIPEGYTIFSAASYVNLPYSNGEVTVTFIPSYEGGVLLDGINDFGKVTGMPIYKDYTVVADYIRTSAKENAQDSPILSKSQVVNNSAFIFNYLNTNSVLNSYSFGINNRLESISDSERKIYYQSKYINDGKSINSGTGTDYNSMWLGTYRDNVQIFFNGAIYSLMSFPYSMSEFLIERQLKKHKLGTLYPNMVEFRPVIKANANYKITYYQIDSTNTWKSIKVGDYIVIGAKLAFQITFDNDASELKEVVSPQLSGIIVEKRPSNPGYNIYSYITSKSPQKINITIDEYIRYEDIVQPYPVLLRFNDENGNEVSWGGKFRVGSTITRIGSFYENNLLDRLYTVRNPKLNGNNLITPTHVVEKSMVFTCDTEYLLDNNEPKVILSPSRLRIPNSSYKLLGYIPDISGHGNHGKINNSAYAEGSGVNKDGSYQLDGVDDFIDIPTLSSGGKQVLMKVNWNTIDSIIYDQRGSGGFAIYCSDYNTVGDSITVPAYKGRNTAGTTYIDGIRNEYIIASQLRNVTHNIVEILDTSYAAGNINPIIGKSYMNANYGSLAFYDFMLFDDISTEDKIKELNEYVGIEAKVELPPYYWDAYGKTNSSRDKATIQQRGVAVGNYDLTNNNFAYDKMSGFGGYEFAKFDNTAEWIYTNNSDTIEVVNRDGYSVVLRKVGNGANYWHFRNTIIKSLGQDIRIGIYANNSVQIVWQLKYKLEGDTDYNSLAIASPTIEGNINTYVTLPYKTEQEIADLNAIDTYYSIYFIPIDLDINEEVTIEMLPLYPNGLVYNGVTDYSENANIPVFTDYTYVFKRELLNNTTDSCSLYKGDTDVVNGQGFVTDYISYLDGSIRGYSFGGYAIVPSLNTDKIIYGTKTSVNGIPVSIGSSVDTVGMALAKWKNVYRKMVFYKLILYPKTIPLLQINFLKNLMEKDEIIDLNNPIFI